jgi:hypothetical protein
MTVGEHSCTRRALLGAAVGLPVVGASVPAFPLPRERDGTYPHPGPLPQAGEGEDWARAVADLLEAERAVRALERETAGLSFEAAEDW